MNPFAFAFGAIRHRVDPALVVFNIGTVTTTLLFKITTGYYPALMPGL